jgi:hypothetical protein
MHLFRAHLFRRTLACLGKSPHIGDNDRSPGRAKSPFIVTSGQDQNSRMSENDDGGGD